MNNRHLAGPIKAFLVLMAVALVIAAAFGLGVTVGSRLPQRGNIALVRTPPPPAATVPGGEVATGVAVSPSATEPATADAVQHAGDIVDNKLIREVWSTLQKQYDGVLPEASNLTYAAIRGLVGSLGDPHTTFLDPQGAAMFSADIEGHFEGIGARVDLAPGGGAVIDYLFPGQPGDQAGLLVGDIVTAVDGRDVTQLTLTEIVGQIRGPDGSKVVLKVTRNDDAPFEVTVVRARIEIQVVTSKTLANGKVAYIGLSEFNSVAPTRLEAALEQALAQKPAGLILDLRGNPGGLLDGAVRIGSYFVPDGNILIERQKDGTEQYYARDDRYILEDTPLVVLVDSGSASASEIVAGAIQDAGSGVLMGTRTYGKGSVQLPNALSDGSQLRVTIAHWFTPKDRAIDKIGLTPDYIVDFTKADAEAKRDPQLDQAVRYLLGDRSGLQTPTPGVTRQAVRTPPAATPVPTGQP